MSTVPRGQRRIPSDLMWLERTTKVAAGRLVWFAWVAVGGGHGRLECEKQRMHTPLIGFFACEALAAKGQTKRVPGPRLVSKALTYEQAHRHGTLWPLPSRPN